MGSYVMSTQDQDSSQNNISDDDVFKILVATDIHLGYAEENPVRGHDTFDTFEEILQHAVKNEVDFILLGGDLFHHAQPSPYCIQKCLELMKKYCLGDRPVSIEFLSNPSQNFTQHANETVNYEDPNLNVSLPVFSIHGNHDDPTGKKHISALDIISTSGLVNYFGRWENLDKVDITPILLQKGKSKLALYGLSHIRDERLGRLFIDQKVEMLSPKDKDDWFHLLVWHQNRATRGSKNFIPDDCLPDFLNLVIWGHEHDCRIEPERKLNDVFISQPGSSVATSLIEGESVTKKVGILKIHETNFKMEPVELQTVRPFKYAEMNLSNEELLVIDKKSLSEQAMQVVGAKVDEMIQEAKNLKHTKKVSEKPLIRLIVKYKDEDVVFNSIRFGQMYADRVANSDNMIKFQLIKECSTRRRLNQNQGADEILEGPVLVDRVEDMVSDYFTEHKVLGLFPLNILNEGVKRFIDSNDTNAIADLKDNVIKEMMTKLELDLPEVEDTLAAIAAIRDSMEADSLAFVNRVLGDPKRKKKKKASEDNDDEDDGSIEDDNSDNEVATNKKQTTKARGGPRGRRGRGAGPSRDNDTQITEDDSNNDNFSNSDNEVATNKKQPTKKQPTKARGGAPRGRRGRGAGSSGDNDAQVTGDNSNSNKYGLFGGGGRGRKGKR
ncbi:double-strand break repair protein MRE11 [Diabrotica virgifera virgifera]|uniref:Double-strand break repair protein n=1 Tax=Diabrotica virgifera virgifera TaxID=50390 RepID=A0A6P7GHC7_DIAVI|nr:double-strand break repair protein MRE11 [Diabrotica virgifera virgifera]